MIAPQLKLLHSNSILAELKERVQLKVEWSGKPEPVIFWSKGADKIQPNQRIETIASGNVFSLIINEVQKQDEGTYTLTAINNIGQDSTAIEIKVNGQANESKR